jgi:hypothetical protein
MPNIINMNVHSATCTVVALLNYTSCGILWRIFSQTGIFAGFYLSYIYLGYFVCLCVIVCVCVTICVGTLCYSFSFSNQTE